MTVKRTFNATHLNEIANLPEVHCWLAGDGPVDLTALIANPLNVALECDEGGFLFVRGESGDYGVHTMFRPRSGAAIEAALEAAEYMFIRTDCVRLTTWVAFDNEAAAKLAKFVGFVPLFTDDNNGSHHLELTLDRWSATNSALEAEGHWFQRALHEAATATPEKPPCEVHDRIVGASIWMMSSGNAAKGLWLHNRWAAHANYPPWAALSLQPPIIHTGASIMEIWPDNLEVLACR